ncbi:MAG: aldolase/citrate lyase family protein, partial [Burkholderiaceae bacterium]
MHPSEVLFQGTQQPVSLPVCDHYAGSEKLMRKSIILQQELGPQFDITLDCEDGASAGNEEAHARMVTDLLASDDNKFNRIGARVHDVRSNAFEQDVSIICEGAAKRLAYLVVPKIDGVADATKAINIINRHAKKAGRENLPIHVLIETHGALAEAHAIAALPQIECLSFGIM